MRKIALTSVILACFITPVSAATTQVERCTDISVPRDAILAHGGRWIELTSDQWQFLRGIFVLNPSTPPGLPFGDKAVLAQVEGDKGGMVFFIDGTKACTPMAVPDMLVSMMQDVGNSTITHEAGSGL